MEWPDGVREEAAELDAEMGRPVVIRRMDGGPRLVIEQPAQLAYDFFTRDASSVGPKAYDQQVGKSDPGRITTADVVAINTTMRARSPHTAWESLTGAVEPLPWLAAIPVRFFLFAASDQEWDQLRPTVEAALTASVGPYCNLSVATKVLHLKRPDLFPVLDSLVVQQIGGYGKAPIELMSHLRIVGRENRLVLAAIAATLEKGASTARPCGSSTHCSGHHIRPPACPPLGEWERVVRPRQQPDDA